MKKVGEIIRVIWNQEENSVKLVLEITDEIFKSKVLHSKDYENILNIQGKDIMISTLKE